MVALQRDYEASVRGAIDAGADAIISGAGLPLSLPAIQKPGDTALIPIVSSARALELICRRWERQGQRPDAVVLEGPLAGGHLGFRVDQVDLPENTLEALLPPVKEVAQAHGDFPVDRRRRDLHPRGHPALSRARRRRRADGHPLSRHRGEQRHRGLQAGGGRARPEDILVANDPGSPCGLPFRVLRESPMYLSALARRRPPKCDKGYVLLKDEKGHFTRCPAKESNEHYFCICNGLSAPPGTTPARRSRSTRRGQRRRASTASSPSRTSWRRLAGVRPPSETRPPPASAFYATSHTASDVGSTARWGRCASTGGAATSWRGRRGASRPAPAPCAG